MERATLAIPMLPILCIGIALLLSTLPAQAATTEVHLVKYASDETTVLNETTVTYEWMEANLPVQGDGVTHYYHQGPMFGEKFENDPWDVNETTNKESRDFGAVKGTDIKDLCELVGGMSPGEKIMIRASDGFRKYFGYINVYEPQPRQGPMVMTWWRADDGYVPDYPTGMRLVFFADDHVFGHWDMHECIAPEYRYNYTDRDGGHPSSGGLSVKNVGEIAIYSMMDPPGLSSIEVSPVSVTLNIGGEQQFVATGYDQYDDGIPDIVFTWTSSDETAGTIDDTGLFAALTAGETVIIAKKEGVQGTASVTVSSPAPTTSPSPTPTPSQVLTAITVSPARATLNVGETQQFTGVAYDQDHREMSDIVFVWTGNAKAVGTIDDTGLFTASSVGDATVTAESDGVIGLAGVTVYLPAPAPASTKAKAETQSEELTSSQSSVPAQDPSPPPSAISPAPKATPNSSGFETPGFEAMFAITGLLMVSCVIKRRKV
ncbi:MAG: Ig-like domain-containing protein [archaeon]|nr:Ig-like domain-containing protein [archaeon]